VAGHLKPCQPMTTLHFLTNEIFATWCDCELFPLDIVQWYFKNTVGCPLNFKNCKNIWKWKKINPLRISHWKTKSTISCQILKFKKKMKVLKISWQMSHFFWNSENFGNPSKFQHIPDIPFFISQILVNRENYRWHGLLRSCYGSESPILLYNTSWPK